MASLPVQIRPLAQGEAAACEAILRDLPDWFGIESALQTYVRDTERYPTWLAEVVAGSAPPAGFLTLHQHFPHAAEIHCLAVRRAHHRGGVGRALVRFAEEECRRLGVRVLQVKTLGPSRPCEFYDRTRAFYLAQGFTPLEEMLTLWPGNPCLVLVKAL